MRNETATAPRTSLLTHVLGTLRRRAKVKTLADSTGASLTGKDVLLRALVLRRLLQRTLARNEKNVGVMLPPTVAGAVANLALALDRRVSVNLNYSLTPELIHYTIGEAGVRHVITSCAFLQRMPIDLGSATPIILEELGKQATTLDKIIAAVTSVLPIPLMERVLGIHDIPNDELMTIIFTSGSTGRPKGVMLPWRSVEANTGMVDVLLQLRPDDVIMGVLPFFHSFGFTITLWTPLAVGVGVVYHTNPLEGRVVGRLIKEHGATILLCTPTFLRAYMQRLTPGDLESLEFAATGSERLPGELADAFEAKFGIRPFQGYGATELGPIVSANVPAVRSLNPEEVTLREGTVGRPARGVRVQVRDPETGAVLGPGERGLLWVTGPHPMLGYLNDPEQTRKVLVDGWYNMGDIVTMDEDGFITIVGRASRFAKIGGEQVPFAAVEEALLPMVGASEDGMPRAAVTAVPNESTGERLMVIHTALDQTPAELTKALAAAGLPRLFIPSPADFHQIDVMPAVGLGKVDLPAIDRIARQAASQRAAAR